jgi:hypothetical protein
MASDTASASAPAARAVGTRRASPRFMHATVAPVARRFARNVLPRTTLRSASSDKVWRTAVPLVALGAVAFLLWRLRCQRTSTPLPAKKVGATTSSVAAALPPLPLQAANTELRRLGRSERASAASLPRPASVERSYVTQAALAIHLGMPAELRRIASEMQRAGRDSEAGLLCNYALLLERSKLSNNRIMAEVTRMLQAGAAACRGSRPQAAPPTSVASPRGGPQLDSRVQPQLDGSLITPIPMLAVGSTLQKLAGAPRRRRASGS